MAIVHNVLVFGSAGFGREAGGKTMDQDDKATAVHLSAADRSGSEARPTEEKQSKSPDTPAPNDDEPGTGKAAEPRKRGRKKGRHPNNVRKIRIERMMSKAELARRANLSVLTIDRVEKGFGCRMDTKRKILEALGLSLADRVRVFGEEE